MYIHLQQSLQISGGNVDEEDGSYIKTGKDLGVGDVCSIKYETSTVICLLEHLGCISNHNI